MITLRSTRWFSALVLCATLLPGSVAVQAQSEPISGTAIRAGDGRPQPLMEVALEQQVGDPLPLETRFLDEQGRPVRLGDFFGERPVILAFVYYECPMLCTLVLNGLLTSLNLIPFDAGRDFDVVAISIDPGEGPELATLKKEIHLERYDRPGANRGWHFLTGEEESIRAVADAAGFRYVYDPDSDEYAHASGVMVVTPEGTLARYFYGIDYPPRDMRFALMEASKNRLGSVVDTLLLFCYQYDPLTGRYGAAVFFLIRLGGIITILVLGSFWYFMWRRERRLRLAAAGEAEA